MRSIPIVVILILASLAIDGSGGAEELSNGDRVTFTKQIAPILFQHCAACHHPGEVAPFSLLSYADAKKRDKQIQTVTAEKFMPPWKSVAGHGRFVGERRLKPEEIDLIARWVASGSVEGDARDLPPAPVFSSDWKLGQPDLVLTLPQPCSVPADGPDVYRNFIFDVSIPAGKYIKAVEFRPGNRRVVHHAVLSMDADGRARKDDAADPEPGFAGRSIVGQLLPGSLSVWTPGRDAVPLPNGFSLPWKAGVGLVLQLHLHPSGKPETEQSTMGIYLTDRAPQRSMIDMWLMYKKLDIPPGEKAYRSRDEFMLPVDMEARGVFPHMHLIGREFKLTAKPPEGESFSLLWINDWDFDWQSFYEFDAPVKLPAGTQIVMETVHDNSAENFRNPNQPPRRVKWGEQTNDEMAVALLHLVPDREGDIDNLRADQGKRIVGGIIAERAKQVEPTRSDHATAENFDSLIDAFLHKNFDHQNAGIVVGLVDEQGTKFFSAGKLDNGTDGKVDADSVFEIGSITKTFTALLLLDMVERGEMKLDDPVAQYLPSSVKVPSHGGKEITLLNLAAQDSGLPRSPDNLSPSPGLPENPYADYTAQRLYEFLSKHSLRRNPGEEFEYSNVGMALLGHAIERTAGTDYESLVVERICRPLQMDSTRVRLTPELKSRLANGHGTAGQPAPNWDFQVYAGAGALRSTANDMLKYVAANVGLAPSKLSPLMEKMHVVRHRGASQYGDTALPWMDRNQSEQTGIRLLGHAGGTGGYETFIGFDKERRRGVVVLCSQQGFVSPEPLGWLLLEQVKLTPQVVAAALSAAGGEIVGVGVKLEFHRESRTLRITEVVPNSPASLAKLPLGCTVQKIDGVPTAGKSELECSGLIRGSAGSQVRLELVDSDGKAQTVELTRQKIQL